VNSELRRETWIRLIRSIHNSLFAIRTPKLPLIRYYSLPTPHAGCGLCPNRVKMGLDAALGGAREDKDCKGDGIMAVVKQLSVLTENKRGALAELCSELAKVAVNIHALMVPEEGRVAPVRLVVSDLKGAEKVFQKLGLKYNEEEVVAARLADRPGALGKLTRKLSDHNVDVKYAYGSILKGTDKGTVILAVSDVKEAVKVTG
jgi:hypothetical protein